MSYDSFTIADSKYTMKFCRNLPEDRDAKACGPVAVSHFTIYVQERAPLLSICNAVAGAVSYLWRKDFSRPASWDMTGRVRVFDTEHEVCLIPKDQWPKSSWFYGYGEGNRILVCAAGPKTTARMAAAATNILWWIAARSVISKALSPQTATTKAMKNAEDDDCEDDWWRGSTPVIQVKPDGSHDRLSDQSEWSRDYRGALGRLCAAEGFNLPANLPHDVQVHLDPDGPPWLWSSWLHAYPCIVCGKACDGTAFHEHMTRQHGWVQTRVNGRVIVRPPVPAAE